MYNRFNHIRNFSALYGNTLLGSTLFMDGGNSPSIRTRSLSVERTKASSVALTKKNSKVSYSYSSTSLFVN